jgi:hypothetical protein
MKNLLANLSKAVVEKDVEAAYRDMINGMSPEFHINTWDAGWYQIRNAILKTSFKTDYDTFMLEYKALERRLREGVYIFGFLRK